MLLYDISYASIVSFFLRTTLLLVITAILLLACLGQSKVPGLQPNPTEKEIDYHRSPTVLHPASKVDGVFLAVLVQSPFQNQIRS